MSRAATSREAVVLRYGRYTYGGYTLTETLVGLVLTLGIVAALGAAAARTRSVLESIARDAEEVEASRVARSLVEHIAKGGRWTVAAAGSDEVAVDFPVGVAVPCDTLWRWNGIRAPDPGRDSAVVLDGWARRWRVVISRADASTCGGERAFDIETAPTVSTAVHLTLFESGVIRVDDAVRYARAGTSRQPLTAAVLDPARSGIERVDSAGATWIRLRVARDSTRVWTRVWRVR